MFDGEQKMFPLISEMLRRCGSLVRLLLKRELR